MERIAYGSAGFDVTPLCIGTWNFAGDKGWGPGDERAAIDLIRHAMERGVNFFDTARGYGNGVSENILGRAVKDRREDVIIASKVLHCPPEDAVKAIDASLHDLDTDYVDLYICHWPRPSLPFEPFFEEMVRQKDAGKIRAIGVSNFNLEQMKVAVQFGAVSLQPPFSILWRIPDETLAFCREQGIVITPYSPLAQGILAGRFTRQDAEISGVRQKNMLLSDPIRPHSLAVARMVDDIADRLGCTSSQVALAWLIQTPGTVIPICGCSRISQLDDNLNALEVTLPDEVYRAFDEAGRKVWDMLGPDETMWGWKPA